MAQSIKIRYAELNGTPVNKTIKAGTTVAQLAEDLELGVSDLFVNGQKSKGSYKLKAQDFVAVITNIDGGNK